MEKKKVILTFPPNIVNTPIVYNLVKDFDLWINIHRAIIEPKTHGKVVLELRGDKGKIEKGLEFAANEGVVVNLLEHDVILNKDKCMDCGACLSICPTGALKLDKETFKLSIDYDECVVCGFCVDVCPVRAIEVNF